ECAQESVECAILRGIHLRVTIAGKYIPQIHQICRVEMRDKIGIAVGGLLMNDVNRIAVHVELQHFRKCNARPLHSKALELSGTWLGYTHAPAPEAKERIFLHRNKCSLPHPASIALGMCDVLGGNHHSSKWRFGAARENVRDLLG